MIMLVDSASLYFRAFHGVPTSVTAPDGTPVNAVRGFLDMLATLIDRFGPDRLVACWDDDWRPAFRVEAIASYKAHRLVPGSRDQEETPDLLVPQVPVIADVLAALGLARVGWPGLEADDVIGTLAERAAAAGTPVDVVTGDRDLFQLVDDARHVRVLYTGKGVRNLDLVDQKRLAERYDVPTGLAYADMAVLRGDPSDGLPGVPGIGEKTAAGLVSRFGSLAELLAEVDAGGAGLSTAQLRRLTEARNYLEAAPTVVQVVRDAPIPEVNDALPSGPADLDALVGLVERWGLRASVNRVLSALGTSVD